MEDGPKVSGVIRMGSMPPLNDCERPNPPRAARRSAAAAAIQMVVCFRAGFNRGRASEVLAARLFRARRAMARSLADWKR